MVRRGNTYQMMLKQYATSRETRSSAMLANRNDMDGRQLVDPVPTNRGYEANHNSPNPNTKDHIPMAINEAANTSGEESSSGADSSTSTGEANDEEDADDDDDKEPEAIAPSDPATRQRGHQTGLSVSLTNATLTDGVNGVNGRKRTWSPGSEGETPRTKRVHQHNAASAVTSDDDDDDYNDVDLISNSDEDEPELEKLEEKMIIDSEEENSDETAVAAVRERSLSASSDDWQGFGIDVDEGLMLADLPFFDEQIGRSRTLGLANGIDLYDAGLDPDLHSSPSPEPPVRRVRFVDDVFRSSASGSSSEDADNDAFPDLFMQQDSLDPGFRQMIENDNDEGQSITDGEGSYWDLDNNEDFELEKHGLKDDSSEGSSSGYETDQGETTDEEVLPLTTIHRPQSLLRIQSPPAVRSKPKPAPRRFPLTPAARRQGPSMGSWVADPTKPIAVIDSTGKHMVFIAPQRPTRRPGTAMTSSSSSTTTSPRSAFATLANPFDDSENDPSDLSGREYGATMLGGNSANVMMSSLFQAAPVMEYIRSGQVIGPPEAFYPFKSIGADGTVVEDDDDDFDDDDEDLWNIHDFIDFGEDSTDSDREGDDDIDAATPTKTAATELTGTTKEGSTAASDPSLYGLLQHFDRGVVSSFRRNQHRHQSLLRRPPSTLSGLKGGRQTAANNPISPLRKRKASRSLSSGTVPFNGIAAKRRIVNHNRSKSSG